MPRLPDALRELNDALEEDRGDPVPPEPEPDVYFIVSRELLTDAYRGWFGAIGYTGAELERQSLEQAEYLLRHLRTRFLSAKDILEYRSVRAST